MLAFSKRWRQRLRSESMLVLSRQRDETIVIGDSIRITIVEVRGDKVRIGIDAPRDVTVHRQEIYEAIKREMNGADSREN
jgi:carbon storage regulator